MTTANLLKLNLLKDDTVDKLGAHVLKKGIILLNIFKRSFSFVFVLFSCCVNFNDDCPYMKRAVFLR